MPMANHKSALRAKFVANEAKRLRNTVTSTNTTQDLYQ